MHVYSAIEAFSKGSEVYWTFPLVLEVSWCDLSFPAHPPHNLVALMQILCTIIYQTLLGLSTVTMQYGYMAILVQVL